VLRLGLRRLSRAGAEPDPAAPAEASAGAGFVQRSGLRQFRQRLCRAAALGQAGCGGTAFIYYPKRTYAFWKQPLYTACFPGPGNCYWRRDCWYDSFGRRFCN
jgi:hypothetical protein